MASNLFKLKTVPNPDGSESSNFVNNTSYAFVHTYLGDDSTGNGTREYPFRSVARAALKNNKIVFRGVINESLVNIAIIGDDINQQVTTSNFGITYGQGTSLVNLTTEYPTPIGYGLPLSRTIFTKSNSPSFASTNENQGFRNCLCYGLISGTNSSSIGVFINNTVNRLNYNGTGVQYVKNSIIITDFTPTSSLS